MSFILAIKKRILFTLLGISLLGFWSLLAFVIYLKNIYDIRTIIIILIFFSSILNSLDLFIVNRNIKMREEYMVVNFGLFYINKKIYYKDIAQFRYAVKNDTISKRQPAWGALTDTVALTFTNGKILFVSVKDVPAFYQQLLDLNCKEEQIPIYSY